MGHKRKWNISIPAHFSQGSRKGMEAPIGDSPQPPTLTSDFRIELPHLHLAISRASHFRRRYGPLQASISSTESPIVNAVMASFSCLRVRAPITGIIFSSFARAQAIANCAGLIPFSSASVQCLDRALVARSIFPHESRKVIAHIAFRPDLRTRQQSPRQHPIRRRRNPQLPSRGKTCFSGPRLIKRVLDLHVGNGMNGPRPPNRLRPHLRQPNPPDISSFHQVRNRANRFLNRHSRIQPRRAVNIDMAQPRPSKTMRSESSLPRLVAHRTPASSHPAP